MGRQYAADCWRQRNQQRGHKGEPRGTSESGRRTDHDRIVGGWLSPACHLMRAKRSQTATGRGIVTIIRSAAIINLSILLDARPNTVGFPTTC